MTDDYARAVYQEDCDRMMRAVKAAIESVEIEGPYRAAVISAAVMTAAQVIDGNKMPEESKIVRPGGIAAALVCLVAGIV